MALEQNFADDPIAPLLFKEVRYVPHVRHRKATQRMAGIGFGPFARFECPVSENRAAPPRAMP